MMVGAVPAGHLTPVNVAVKLPFPVLRNIVKLRPASAVGIVKVQLSLRVYVCSVLFVMAIVWDVPVLPLST